MVRTLAEVNADRIRVTVELVDDRSEHALYGAALDAERELLAAQREIQELKGQRAGDAGTIEGLNEKVMELGQQLLTSQQAREIETRRAQGYDHDRHTERDRADRNGARVKELETELERYRRSHVCTVECGPNAHTAFQGRQLTEELTAERDAALTRVGELDGDLRRLREELNRRFTTAQVEDAKAGAREDARAVMQREVVKPLDDKLAEAEQGLQALADLVGKVNSLALGSEVRRALEYLPAEPGTYAHTVSVTLRRIRELLGVSWGGPGTPREV